MMKVSDVTAEELALRRVPQRLESAIAFIKG